MSRASRSEFLRSDSTLEVQSGLALIRSCSSSWQVDCYPGEAGARCGARVFLDTVAASLLDHETLDVQLDPEAKSVNFHFA